MSIRAHKFGKTFLFLTICFTCIIIYLYSYRQSESDAHNSIIRKINGINMNKNNRSMNIIKMKDKMVLSLVACDSRLNESLTMMKSVLIFTISPVHFVIFADDMLQSKFDKKLSKWQQKLQNSFTFQLEHIKFPEKHKDYWLHLFGRCAAQRLFMPNLLPEIDSLIYLDTDTLFLGPVDMLWHFFKKFNSTQISALTLEDVNPMSWYSRFAKHPYYGNFGVNSGVMLMNLTRMRNFHWENLVTPIMMKYKLSIPWGDQDIINVIFHYHPEWLLVLPCEYNYRSEQCEYGLACPSRAVVLHGSRRAFHSQHQPAFQAVYEAMEEYEIGTDLRLLAVGLQQHLENTLPSNCGSHRQVFIGMPFKMLDIPRDNQLDTT